MSTTIDRSASVAPSRVTPVSPVAPVATNQQTGLGSANGGNVAVSKGIVSSPSFSNVTQAGLESISSGLNYSGGALLINQISALISANNELISKVGQAMIDAQFGKQLHKITEIKLHIDQYTQSINDAKEQYQATVDNINSKISSIKILKDKLIQYQAAKEAYSDISSKTPPAPEADVIAAKISLETEQAAYAVALTDAQNAGYNEIGDLDKYSISDISHAIDSAIVAENTALTEATALFNTQISTGFQSIVEFIGQAQLAVAQSAGLDKSFQELKVQLTSSSSNEEKIKAIKELVSEVESSAQEIHNQINANRMAEDEVRLEKSKEKFKKLAREVIASLFIMKQTLEDYNPSVKAQESQSRIRQKA